MTDKEEEKQQSNQEGKEKQDEEEEIDENCFNQKTDLVETSKEQEFSCTNPSNKGGHYVYKCKGVSSEGSWEGDRRYNEFFKLHEKLEQRWPGIPIPCLPPKKMIGNKELKFINERRFYLERFLKKLASFDFLVKSEEFLIFSNPKGDIDKQLSSLPKISTNDIVEKLKVALNLQDDYMYDTLKKDKLDIECKQFQHFAKQIIPILSSLLKQIKSLMQNKNQSNQDYKLILLMFEKYEGFNLNNYVDGQTNKMVFGNEEINDSNIKDQILKLSDNLKNPFFHLFHWCQGEIFDIEAINNALQVKDKIFEGINKKLKEKKSQEENLKNLAEGRKTVKGMFATKDANVAQQKVEQSDKEIESLKQLHDLLVIYMGEQIVPSFKQRKVKIYKKIIQSFSVMQISNAHQIASFWSQVLSIPIIQKANDEEIS